MKMTTTLRTLVIISVFLSQAAAQEPGSSLVLRGPVRDRTAGEKVAPSGPSQIRLPTPPARVDGAPLPRSSSRPRPPITDVIVIIDATASMQTYCGRQRRIGIAQWAAFDVVDSVPDGVACATIALVDDASEIRPLQPFTGDERSSLRRTFSRLRPTGSGELKDAFEKVNHLLEDKPDAAPVVVLITDGQDCHPGEAHGAAAALKRKYGDRWRFEVIGICTHTPVMNQLRSLAEAGDGAFSGVHYHHDLFPALAEVRDAADAVREQRAMSARRCQQELIACRERERELTLDLENIRQTLDDLRQEFNDSVAKHTLQVAKLRRQLQGKESHAAALTGQLSDAEEQIQAVTADCDRARRQYAAALWGWGITAFLFLLLAVCIAWWLYGRIARLHRKLADARQALLHTQEEVETLGRDKEELEKQIVVLEGEIARHLARQDELTADRDACRETVAQQRVQLARCEERSSCCAAELDAQRREIERLTRELENCVQARHATDREVDDLRQQRERDRQTLQEVTAARAHAESAVEQLQRQIESLQRQLEACERGKIQLSAWLNQCQRDEAAADARALGATREMAANKKDKDCCGHCGPSAIMGPTVTATPATPSNPSTRLEAALPEQRLPAGQQVPPDRPDRWLGGRPRRRPLRPDRPVPDLPVRGRRLAG